MDPDFTSWTIAMSKGQKQQIGEGEFGTIFKARTDRNQTVAVKIVCIKVVGNSTLVDSIIHEEKLVFENLKKIRHPNVVQFLKFESSPSEMQVCIFTEIISGDSLLELMAEQKKPFEEPRVREFSLQICSALNFLHSRKPVVLHRDIKCSNIMLTNEGVIKLIDFGFAKEIAKTASPSQTESPEGCLYFMAPELFTVESQGVPTPRCTTKTDVWAFGCTIFQMLNMQPPYQDVPRSEIQQTVAQSDTPQLPGVSDSLHEFYNRCLVKNPEDRADTSELLQTRLLKRSASDVDSTALDEKFIEWSFIFNDNGKKELVGEGEFSKVYKAFTDKHQTVAVKVRKNFRTLDRQGNPHMEGIFDSFDH